jgi:hypothetical protein
MSSCRTETFQRHTASIFMVKVGVVKLHTSCKNVAMHIHGRGVKSFLIISFPSCDGIYCGPEKGIFLCTTWSPFLVAKTTWITNFLKTHLNVPEHRHKPTRLHGVTTQKSTVSMTTVVNTLKLIPQSLFLPLLWEMEFHTHTKDQVKYSSVYKICKFLTMVY